jgi:hypothetical protein
MQELSTAIINEETLQNIADSIRDKNKKTSKYTPSEMIAAINNLPSLEYQIRIIQSDHQKITASCTNNVDTDDHDDDFTVYPTSMKATARITSDTGYTAGTLNQTSFILTPETPIAEFYATEATLNTYTIDIRQSDHQTITVTCNGTDYTETFTAHYGDTISAKVVADEGYIAGTLSSYSTTITYDTQISATDARSKIHTINITQSEHETITVTYNGKEYTSTFTVNDGDTVSSITISADDGYIYGTLKTQYINIGQAINCDATISADPATKAQKVLTDMVVNASFNLHSNGTRINTSSITNNTFTYNNKSYTIDSISEELDGSGYAVWMNTYTVQNNIDNASITMNTFTPVILVNKRNNTICQFNSIDICTSEVIFYSGTTKFDVYIPVTA